MHTVLARKWRPKKFADLIGQTSSVTVLKNIIQSTRLHHAYLLTGTRGVGKTTIARIIAKALNCLKPQNTEPCGTCESCLSIDSGRFVDVIEIDAASNTGVDNIRELIDNAQYTPTGGKYKIYIIDEVHMLSKSAFNAMLKTLEEPPQHVIFILATTDPQKVPITVLSRCLQLKLRHLLPPEIAGHLAYVLNEEQIKFEKEGLELIAASAKGSMRDALSLLDQAIAFSNNIVTTDLVKQMLGITDDKLIFAILDALVNLDGVGLVNLAKEIYLQGHDLENILQNLNKQLCNLSINQLAGVSESTNLNFYTDKISVNDVQLYFEISNLGLEQITKANDKYPVFIMTLLRMLAFNIGSQEKREIIINHSNFHTKHRETQTAQQLNHEQSEIIKLIEQPAVTKNPPKAIITAEEISPTQIPTSRDTENVEPAKPIIKKFSGDWFGLITSLKTKLGHLYPILENAKLAQYTDTKFNIIVDKKYAAVLNENRQAELTQILNENLSYHISLEIEFNQDISDTLKEKSIQEKSMRQELAEKSIMNDENLAKIISQFSAKITSGSIKPIN